MGKIIIQDKHTPGPWHRNIKSEDARYPVVFAGRNTHIAMVKGHGEINPQEIEANIDLIAAAPELLFALQEVLANYEDWPEEDLPGYVSLVTEVIAKATGEKL